ncbi:MULTISPECIES: serine/threonine-protein kinase [Pseudofrankia]|uniref:serine/threonine-protein kinase n=1 Tax=Pseudofrankia TaxID=2994363 RepID=UPI001E45E7D9|nr:MULTISPECIES: serine/threonine-protein kinase [Pseudofrankia]
MIGPFRMTGRLGSGGMGTVYLGFGPDDRPVAVKVPTPELAGDPRFRARFRREVDAVRMISSGSVATVVDADTEAESPWLATEYVEGATLLDAVAGRGPLAPRLVVGFAAGLADGLVAMHAVGVVHRDLKPANVILGWEGPKIIDFGVALTTQPMLGGSTTDSDPDLTQARTQIGQRVGTLVWMAPEQLRGETVGPPADVFAWGACVTYATTGHSPFHGSSPLEAVGLIQHAEPDLAGVPPQLVDLVRAALAKDPRARPSATVLVSGLLHREIHTPQESDQAVETALVTWVEQPPTPAPPLALPPSKSPAPSARSRAAAEADALRGTSAGQTLNLRSTQGLAGQPRQGRPGEPSGPPRGDRSRPAGRDGARPGYATGPLPVGGGPGREGDDWTDGSDIPTYVRPPTGPLPRGNGGARTDAFGAAAGAAAAGWSDGRGRPGDGARTGRSTAMKALLAAALVVLLAGGVALALVLTSHGGGDDSDLSVSATSPTSATSASSTPSVSVSASTSEAIESVSASPSSRRTTRPPSRRPTGPTTTSAAPATDNETDTQGPRTTPPITSTGTGTTPGTSTSPPGASRTPDVTPSP